MRRTLVVIVVLAACAGLSAQNVARHTLIVLSHSNDTMYWPDPATGAAVHQFVAPEQPHEAAISSDGATVFASVPAAGFVEILDAATFKEKGRIETPFFKRPPTERGGDSASPHGMALTTDGSKL